MSIRFSCALAAMFAMLVGGCAFPEKKPPPAGAIDPSTTDIELEVVRHLPGKQPDYAKGYWRVKGSYSGADNAALVKSDGRTPQQIFWSKFSGWVWQQKVDVLITARVTGVEASPTRPILHVTATRDLGNKTFTPFARNNDDVYFTMVSPRLVEGSLENARLQFVVQSVNASKSNLIALTTDVVVGATALTNGRTVALALKDRINLAAEAADGKLEDLVSADMPPIKRPEAISPIRLGTDKEEGVEAIKVYAVEKTPGTASKKTLILTIANQRVETLLGAQETFDSVSQNASTLLNFQLTRDPDKPGNPGIKVREMLESANKGLFGPLLSDIYPDANGKGAFIQSFCRDAPAALEKIVPLTEYDKALIIWALLAQSPWATDAAARPAAGNNDKCETALMPLTTVPYLKTNFHATLPDPRPVGNAAIAWASDSFKKLRGDPPHDKQNPLSIPAIFNPAASGRAELLMEWLDTENGVWVGSKDHPIDIPGGSQLNNAGTLLTADAAAKLLAGLPLTWIQQNGGNCFERVESTGNRVGARAHSACMRLGAGDTAQPTRTLFVLDAASTKIKRIWFFDNTR